MHLSQRLDQRLNMLRDEVRIMTQEKERGERVWRDRLQRCQRQLKAKEEEMSRQSQYFETYKAQLQQKLSVSRDREQTLQNRIYTLEKQLLHMTVSAATGRTTIGAARITAGTVTCSQEQDRLPSMRGEGEGEEEKKEERRKQGQPSVGTEAKERQEEDEGKTENDVQGGQNKDAKHTSNAAQLQSFILSLQEDLRVLLEREEDRMAERRGLMEQLQEAQENSQVLGCRAEGMKAEVHQLKLSESCLMEEVEELREENQRLQELLRKVTYQTPSQSFTVTESSHPGAGTSSPGAHSLPPTTTAMGAPEGLPSSGEGVVPAIRHQTAAEDTQMDTDGSSPSSKSRINPKNDPLNNVLSLNCEHNTDFKSLSFTTESLDEFKLGNWCSKGVLNLEESPSEESDALRDAYKSLGFEEDLKILRQQCDKLQVTLLQRQDELRATIQENDRLKLQLRKQAEGEHLESSKEKIIAYEDTHLQSSTHGDISLDITQDGLVQALNQENRALADRIRELLAHIELREEEITEEKTHLRESSSSLQEDVVRLEQEKQEQEGLILELTKKTEDDLNTIMELQQKLAECEEKRQEVDMRQCRTQWESEHTAVISRSLTHDAQKECMMSSLSNMLRGGEEDLMFNQETNPSISDSASDCLHNNPNGHLEVSLPNSLLVSSQKDEVTQLTSSIRSLKTEKEDLTFSINSLKEQQREGTISLQAQTEEKQQLTRTIWGLKEEKDCISQSLAGLRQQKEQLSRTVCGLKDKKDQFTTSMNVLKDEKELLTKSLSSLGRDKGAIIESLSRSEEERDQIMHSLRSLQIERDELSQALLSLKAERDELTNSLKCLKEQRDQEQLSYTLKEDSETLIKSVSSLKEEKEKTVCSKQDQKQIMLVIHSPREEKSYLEAVHIQTQTEKNQRQHLLNPGRTDGTKKTDSAQRCQTNGGLKQEESDLTKENETLRAELLRSQGELNQSRIETERLHSELCQSEGRREEAERNTVQAAEMVTRLTEVNIQMEETKKENYSLETQVKELQRKLTCLRREMSDALSLKIQTEEQHNILSAQLRAKTVALEELNSEYIALKRGQGSRDDLSAVLVSLRSRYNDIRAKYDAILKRNSQTDLDIAPLKAKLSCLVVKCQQRNNLLAQMMKVMHREGCVDLNLALQVENVLSDATLQDYSAMFTLGSNTKNQEHYTGFTSEFIPIVQDFSSVFIHDQTSLPASTSVNKRQKNGATPEDGGQCREREKHTSAVVSVKYLTNLHGGASEVTPAGVEQKSANSPLPTSPLKESAGVQVSLPAPATREESPTPNTEQVFPADTQPEKTGSHLEDGRGKCSPHRTSPGRSVLRSASPSPSRRLSSPEKILNLHEQLQKTLRSSYRAPDIRGRRQQPRRSLSLSAPSDLNTSSHIKEQNSSLNVPHVESLKVTTASNQTREAPAVKTEPSTTNKSATLFNAVASRSANARLSPSMFTNHRLKVDATTTSSSNPSRSFLATEAGGKVESSSNSRSTIISSILTHEVPAFPDNVSHQPCSPFTDHRLTASTVDLKGAKPKTTASKISKFNMTSGSYKSSCSQSVPFSPERSGKSARKSAAAREKTAKPKPEAPAEVRSVEVIKTVGLSSLLIGWERPPLDALGCSNGTFVYGYRVFVDGDFHKSVMSSACTKCVLENVDLSIPVNISVQTLGSNGLISDSVHTLYRT